MPFALFCCVFVGLHLDWGCNMLYIPHHPIPHTLSWEENQDHGIISAGRVMMGKEFGAVKERVAQHC